MSDDPRARREAILKSPWVERHLGRGNFGAVLRYKAEAHWMDFELHLVVGLGQYGVRMFETGVGVGANRLTANLDEALPLVEGFIKWDGCMQFNAGGAGSYAVHVDTWQALKDFGGYLLDVRRVAAVQIGNWDGEKQD